MLISGHFFLAYFFPFFLLIYFLFHKNKLISNLIILIFSILFYASFHLEFIPLLFGLLLLDFVLAWVISASKGDVKKILLFLGVASSLIILGYYKYSLLMVTTIREVFNPSFFGRFKPVDVLPVGISFFTFQRISYLVDVYKEKVKPTRSIIDYFVYGAFFSPLIAGPIVRFKQVEDQVHARKINWQKLYSALKFISIGLFAKTIVADGLFVLEEELTLHLPQLSTLTFIILILTFSFRIYFDFLGYSLLAVGLAKTVGFDFPENFDSPYISLGLRDFWKRWNITLSEWIRDYIYIPLGGSRRGKILTYVNLMVAMLLAGLWHGANWSMMIWGGLHGLGLVFERLLNKYASVNLPKFVVRIVTFVFVTLAWIPFKFTKLKDIQLIPSLVIQNSWGWYDQVSIDFFWNAAPYLLISVLWIVYAKEKSIKKIKMNGFYSFMFVLLFIFSFGYSLVKRSAPFIYFQF